MNRQILTEDFLQFINASPSPFHAVKSVKERLVAAGFQELKEKSQWPQLEPMQKYFVCRNQSSIIALAAGGKINQQNSGGGFSILAAHTDSPCLKVKPVSKKQNCGYLQVGVQLYGGGIWHTWFDRDLSLAGRVIYRSSGGDNSLKSALVKIDRPILRIPTLAIHLDRTANDKFEFNKETQLTPMIATVVQDKLNQPAPVDSGLETSDKHHSVLIKLLVDNLPIGVKADDILDFELCLFDTQLSCTGGIYNEFIFSPRLDNLFMSYCSVKSLLDAMPSLDQDSNIRVVALFDNEEVGSESAYGAGSSFLEDTLRRFHNQGDFEKAVQSSILVSADMAHAIHPNYSEKHESNHQPKFHEGVVIKQNANQRYATTAVSSAIFKQIASYSAKNGNRKREPVIPLQEFVVRNDSPCGSTIGPILSSKLGLRTIDVGCPQLSMHSIRECAATTDLKHAVDLFVALYEDFAIVDKSMNVD